MGLRVTQRWGRRCHRPSPAFQHSSIPAWRLWQYQRGACGKARLSKDDPAKHGTGPDSVPSCRSHALRAVNILRERLRFVRQR
eukprot:gene9164-biopygen2485